MKNDIIMVTLFRFVLVMGAFWQSVYADAGESALVAPVEADALYSARFFTMKTLPDDEAVVDKLVRSVVYRSANNSGGDWPIYFYVQSRLYGVLLPGGYQSVLACDAGTYQFIFSLQPLSDRELKNIIESPIVDKTGQIQKTSVTLGVDAPVTYFSVTALEGGSSIAISTVPEGPSRQERLQLRQLRSVVRAPVVSEAACDTMLK